MREFWLTEHKEYDFWYAHDSEQYDDDVHVIEKSAFDSILKDAQGLVEALEFYAQGAPVIGYDRGERAVEAIQSFNEKWGSHE